jgi:primary-amine oxidase
MFVTPHSDEEIFPSELHINQHPRDENVENADIVAWPCFGVTHISRPEDWPIMPVEILRVHLKPSGFFDVSEQLPH